MSVRTEELDDTTWQPAQVSQRVPSAWQPAQQRRRVPVRKAAGVGGRAAKASATAAARGIATYPRQFAPVGAMAATFAAGSAMHSMGLDPWFVVGGGAVIAGAARGFGRRAWHALKTTTRIYATAVTVFDTGWVAAYTAHGPTWQGPPAAAMFAGAIGLSGAWWLAGPGENPPEEVPELDDTQRLINQWRRKVAGPDGPLPGSRLSAIKWIPGGWMGIIELEKGNCDRAVAATKDVGARLKLTAASVSIERTPNGDLHLARIIVVTNNPLRRPIIWAGPDLDVATGNSTIGVYADGESVTGRDYRPGEGGIHELVAGATGSGKTGYVKMRICGELHSGLIISYLIDPQRGQSYGEIKQAVHRFAGDIRQARTMLRALRDRMYARNEFLSNLPWKDEQRRNRVGGIDFTPLDPRHGLRQVNVTIDEAQDVLADDECKALVEEMVALSRKCGIKFRLIVHTALQNQLGNSQAIKNAVAAGTVIVLRSANPLTGQAAFNGAMPVDPAMLPKQWPDGSSTAGLGYIFAPGADRAAPMRLCHVPDEESSGSTRDVYYWATTANRVEDFDCPEIDALLRLWAESAAESDGIPRMSPAPTVGVEQTPTQDELAERRTVADGVLAVLGDGQERSRGQIIADVREYLNRPVAVRSVGDALTKLVKNELIDRIATKDLYVITDAGRARLEELRGAQVGA